MTAPDGRVVWVALAQPDASRLSYVPDPVVSVLFDRELPGPEWLELDELDLPLLHADILARLLKSLNPDDRFAAALAAAVDLAAVERQSAAGNAAGGGR